MFIESFIFSDNNQINYYISSMTSIVITPKNKSDLDLISNLLKKLKIDATFLTDEEKEEIGLKILMNEADRSKTVPINLVIKKLKSK